MHPVVDVFLKKWAYPGLFLFIFVLFRHKFYGKKTLDLSVIRTQIVGIEGKHADHLTTTTAHCHLVLDIVKIFPPLLASIIPRDSC